VSDDCPWNREYRHSPAALFTVPGPLVAVDGEHFLVLTALEDVPPSPITVIVNWAGREK
jgi:hypothetical protein